jgi:hypothetical protein
MVEVGGSDAGQRSLADHLDRCRPAVTASRHQRVPVSVLDVSDLAIDAVAETSAQGEGNGK